VLLAYEEGVKDGRADAIREIIHILNGSHVKFRQDGRDLREYLMARMGVDEKLWPLYLEGEVCLTQEEVDKLPQI
jgi:hypothetical protein